MKPYSFTSVESDAAPESEGDDRAARLLRGMHKVFSHDLPNQLVALQSLLQLLHADEWDRLGPDGREHLRRLVSAAEKAGAQVRFLKEMARLHRYQSGAEPVALAPLLRELQAELNQLFPGGTLAYAWDLQVASVWADPRFLGQALRELLGGLLQSAPAARWRVEGGARAGESGAELTFRVVPEGAASSPRRAEPAEQRLEFVLAREWLAAWGARLLLPAEGRGPGSFAILLPR